MDKQSVTTLRAFRMLQRLARNQAALACSWSEASAPVSTAVPAAKALEVLRGQVEDLMTIAEDVERMASCLVERSSGYQAANGQVFFCMKSACVHPGPQVPASTT